MKIAFTGSFKESNAHFADQIGIFHHPLLDPAGLSAGEIAEKRKASPGWDFFRYLYDEIKAQLLLEQAAGDHFIVSRAIYDHLVYAGTLPQRQRDKLAAMISAGHAGYDFIFRLPVENSSRFHGAHYEAEQKISEFYKTSGFECHALAGTPDECFAQIFQLIC